MKPDNPRASDALSSVLRNRPMDCPLCGYTLTTAPNVMCPECGRVIPRPPPASALAGPRAAPIGVGIALGVEAALGIVGLASKGPWGGHAPLLATPIVLAVLWLIAGRTIWRRLDAPRAGPGWTLVVLCVLALAAGALVI